MNYPKDWDNFCHWLKNNSKENLDPNIKISELNRFAARFRLGKSYQGLSLADYPEASVSAYSSVLGVFLAYSALEQLYQAVGNPKSKIANEWAIYDADVYKKLRRSTRILGFLQEKVTSKSLKNEIGKFIEGQDKNILPICQAVRHLVAHGVMTIHSRKVKPQTMENFCKQLTEVLHIKTQSCFYESVINLLPKS